MKYTEPMVVAYRDGHDTATWERQKPANSPRNGRELRRRAMEACFDAIVPGVGSVPASSLLQKYRRTRDRGAFVGGWVDAMNGRDARPKVGDDVKVAEQESATPG